MNLANIWDDIHLIALDDSVVTLQDLWSPFGRAGLVVLGRSPSAADKYYQAQS